MYCRHMRAAVGGMAFTGIISAGYEKRTTLPINLFACCCEEDEKKNISIVCHKEIFVLPYTHVGPLNNGVHSFIVAHQRSSHW